MSAKTLIVPITALALVLSSCSSVETIELSLDIPAEIDEALLADSGTITYATAEILGDLTTLVGDLPALDDLLASEAIAGTMIREAYPSTPASDDDLPPQADSSGLVVENAVQSTAVPPASEAFTASNLLTGTLLPTLYGDPESRSLAVDDSSQTEGTGSSGSAESASTVTITRSGQDALSLSVANNSSTAGGTRVSSTISLEGTVCPGADGDFDFTIRLTRVAATTSGDGGEVSQEFTVDVTGRLGDDGLAESMTIVGVQITTEAPPTGEPITVETRQRLQGATADTAQRLGRMPAELVSSSSGATDDDVRRLARDASARMAYFAWGAVLGVESSMWNNGCVMIDALSPGTVEPLATSTIAVDVLSRLSGESIESSVAIGLTGAESVAPALLTSPGSVTHVAGEAGTSGTVALSATSRRGAAGLTLTITAAGQSYFAEGGGGDLVVRGEICDLAQPFVLTGEGITLTFTPESEAGGTRTYEDDGRYGGGLIELTGEGPYEVIVDAGGVPIGIVGSGTGTSSSAAGTFEFPLTDEFTLTPLDAKPAECG